MKNLTILTTCIVCVAVIILIFIASRAFGWWDTAELPKAAEGMPNGIIFRPP